jgi:hypothetical protein
MAGTIFGLGLSQRVDLNGNPASGWLLYIYSANSSTPVNSYQDTALSVLNPWPLEADTSGMMPQFWLADGSYRARGISSDGSVTYFDIPAVQALGPSSGSAPSGGVDPNAIFQTGDVIWQDIQGTRSGWVRDNGRTIGSATSGATERANADCQSLFQWLWNNFSNALCPVSGGRGANSLSDWTANKTITLPDKRGYILGGLDDMGNSAASRWSGATVVSGSVTTAASTLGETSHTISSSEMPSHQHSVYLKDPGHTHTVTVVGGGGSQGAAAGPYSCSSYSQNQTPTISTATTSITIGSVSGTANDNQTATTGGGSAHNNVQLTVLGTFFRKL